MGCTSKGSIGVRSLRTAPTPCGSLLSTRSATSHSTKLQPPSFSERESGNRRVVILRELPIASSDSMAIHKCAEGVRACRCCLCSVPIREGLVRATWRCAGAPEHIFNVTSERPRVRNVVDIKSSASWRGRTSVRDLGPSRKSRWECVAWFLCSVMTELGPLHRRARSNSHRYSARVVRKL